MAITSKAGFWADNYQTLIGSARNLRRNVARLFRGIGSQGQAELLETLIGAAAGSTAARTITQVQHNESPGGVGSAQGAVETRTLVNRATTSDDETNFEEMVTAGTKTRPASYAADLSGNGGGGKLQD